MSKCLAAAAKENSGVLKKELTATVRDISFGGGVYQSLFRFADRLSFPSVKRTVLFAAETGHYSGDISLPFQTGADDAAHSLSLRTGQKSGMQLYVLIMYISYFVFIFVQFILSGVFIDAVSAANAAADTGMYLGILTDAVLIHGICCGLAAGKMSGGGISSGILHACVLLAAGLAASIAVWIL
ncbi:MAG TPA: type II secretion system F family protein [Methanocorpusculum sp.]|nr:type II secretion system F family protein [Methanocorpusculum sp.]HJJ32768.1 type II secretion system F family protein [Methanocorpusculum sp.]HJJ44537.1 type II secretion system F family protein [Methanocorpusculum sp.]HJJ58861.1 type II secretion system F family protein [Methanocorpusculum sp.]HJJ59401.1 type II secretion system F family protein [Methanocorpusculum sp.]